MTELLHAFRSRRAAALALLLAVCVQLASLTHEAVEEHSLGEHCEVCLLLDRSDDALLANTDLSSSPGLQVETAIAGLQPDSSLAVPAARNRGPPRI